MTNDELNASGYFTFTTIYTEGIIIFQTLVYMSAIGAIVVIAGFIGDIMQAFSN